MRHAVYFNYLRYYFSNSYSRPHPLKYNHYIFLAEVLLGILGGAVPPFLQILTLFQTNSCTKKLQIKLLKIDAIYSSSDIYFSKDICTTLKKIILKSLTYSLQITARKQSYTKEKKIIIQIKSIVR